MRPTQLSPYAEVVLQALAGAGVGHKISLGGALGLQHYCEYRVTNDIDAWWEPSATGEERAEPEQRAAAASLRNWFSQEFFDALVD
jgi:hypothetical protein